MGNNSNPDRDRVILQTQQVESVCEKNKSWHPKVKIDEVASINWIPKPKPIIEKPPKNKTGSEGDKANTPNSPPRRVPPILTMKNLLNHPATKRMATLSLMMSCGHILKMIEGFIFLLYLKGLHQSNIKDVRKVVAYGGSNFADTVKLCPNGKFSQTKACERDYSTN
ncbi:hypothetical protein FRX31_022926 [Thalictrum thalictroides]|uniref:Uncharacterized protein n=1 Tax=Thalictrum thalictroides TaxID=46969 RepID=A0A7J6VRY1_THATH|nr:hypothetical protein FRX31_022926 [Thalictrum thalictroides]